jgi:hypothetical protein
MFQRKPKVAGAGQRNDTRWHGFTPDRFDTQAMCVTTRIPRFMLTLCLSVPLWYVCLRNPPCRNCNELLFLRSRVLLWS